MPERAPPITTGVSWPVRITLGTCLLAGTGAATEVQYTTAQADVAQMPESQPLLPQAEDIAMIFRRHVAAWKAEKRASASSKLESLFLSEHYQEIIGMGPAVVPLLLAELQATPDHWDWALGSITRQDPVPPEAAGKLREIANAWVTWGRARSLI